MPTQWSDTQHEMLRTDWADPKNSLSEIAAHINAETGSEFSRNAIAGKANRLHLPLRRQPNSRHGQRAAPKPRKPSNRPVSLLRITRPKCKPLVATIALGEPAHLGLTLLDLNNTTCKFPRGDEQFTFCGQPSLEGGSYCGFHHQLCYRPPESRNPVRRAA
jgi:GcrA cell cycle regulator